MLEPLITSTNRCKTCHEPVCLLEDRKKAVGLACLQKIECSNQKYKQTDNNLVIPMAKEWIFL